MRFLNGIVLSLFLPMAKAYGGGGGGGNYNYIVLSSMINVVFSFKQLFVVQAPVHNDRGTMLHKNPDAEKRIERW